MKSIHDDVRAEYRYRFDDDFWGYPDDFLKRHFESHASRKERIVLQQQHQELAMRVRNIQLEVDEVIHTILNHEAR